MTDMTFLTIEEVLGNNKLDIFSQYGTKCAITDFSIFLGGYVSDEYCAKGGRTKADRTGYWWTKTSDGDNDARVVGTRGYKDYDYVYNREGGARPALPYSSIQNLSSNVVRGANGILEVQYGEYPQMVVKDEESRILERAYNNGLMKRTGRIYTTDSVDIKGIGKEFTPYSHIEYEYGIDKFIRVIGNSNSKNKILSDGRTVRADQSYWIRVEPITWFVDKKANIALSKKIIFSGVQFNKIRNYQGNFEKTDIKKFMDQYFAKEIVAFYSFEQIISEKEEKIEKPNPYGFNFNLTTEEEIIRGAIESNVSVFLHGRSSDGKSARVKQLDPDCEIIYMRNATPDSLNGKSVYNAITGEMIDVAPTWYLKVKEKCEREKDKIHIIFFDELTNALPSIQGMAFNIVLDGEVNGKWKLPPNARIVASGNDLNDSLAANQMAEPLFNRFAHVYINTTVDSWLKWASTPIEKYERLNYREEKSHPKIHPSIYAYIAYKSYGNQDVLRTPYTGEKPNADPRKWEMASKVLYQTNQPDMLRALIGEELTRDFTAFVRQKVITIEDVMNHNYSMEDLEMDTSQKFATAAGLSSVDEEHFEVIRDFMDQIGKEPKAAFESMWTHGDERRLEYLKEILMEENVSQGGIKR